MDINVEICKIETVRLTARTMHDITMKHLSDIFGISGDMYIEGDELMRSVEHHTSHSYFTEESVRAATDDDRLYFSVRNILLQSLGQ